LAQISEGGGELEPISPKVTYERSFRSFLSSVGGVMPLFMIYLLGFLTYHIVWLVVVD
jgi:hypothetical protein